MADLSQIKIGDVVYDIKDSVARAADGSSEGFIPSDGKHNSEFTGQEIEDAVRFSYSRGSVAGEMPVFDDLETQDKMKGSFHTYYENGHKFIYKLNEEDGTTNWQEVVTEDMLPDFAKVATSGEYTDLNNKPTFKTINNQSILGEGNITIQGGSGGGDSNKTKYLHVFEYSFSMPPNYNVIVYVPSDTPDLLGADILTQKADDVGTFRNQIFVPGMFAVISLDDMYTNEPPCTTPLKFKYYENAEFGEYYLGVELMGDIREFSDINMTFISEKVI